MAGRKSASRKRGRQHAVLRRMARVQRFGHGAKIGGYAARHRRCNADHVGNLIGRNLHEACARQCRRGGADNAGGVPARAAPSFRCGAIDATGDLGGDDERRQHVGLRGPGRLGDGQDRGDDPGDRLAGHIGEVEIHGVVGDAVGESG
jgi:hypothetical protein